MANIAVVAKGLNVDYVTRIRRHDDSGVAFRMPSLWDRKRVNHAVREVSLIGYEGEAIGVVGRNGSGKSTLLRALAGVEKPSSGRVFARSRPQFMGVSSALLPNRSGLENIRLGCFAMGLNEDEISEALPQVKYLSDLGEALYNPISTYSSGMAARLRFSIAAINPHRDVLFIDEALGTGDAAFQARSKEAIRSIIDNSGTIFLVSHAARMVESLCDRALWMHEGEIVMDGSADEVAKNYRYWSIHSSKGNHDAAARILRIAKKNYRSPLIDFV